MSIFQSIILGIIQGLTEFVPISSSGHLVLVRDILGWPDSGLGFDVILHLGTLLAILIYFRQEWIRLIKSFFLGVCSIVKPELKDSCSKEDRNLIIMIIIATIPAGVAGLMFGGVLNFMFRSIPWVVSFLFITAFLMIGVEMRRGKKYNTYQKHRSIKEISFWDAAAIGIAQAVAILPGISRSGVTISAGIFRGLKRSSAARFSFLLSAPIILGAGLVNVCNIIKEGQFDGHWYLFLFGFVFSFIFGFLSIKYMITYLKTKSLRLFVYYLIGLGIVLLVFNYLR